MFAIPAPPAGRTLAEDTPCRRCGYNLRSLRESGKCPECATPVALSLRDDLLKFADPKWMRMVALGASLVGFAIVGCLVAVVVLMVILAAGIPLAWPVFLIWPPAGAVMLVGQWLVTRRDPSAPLDTGKATTGLMVRVLLIVTLALLFMLSGVQRWIGPLGPLSQTLVSLFWTVLTVAWVLLYFRHLAELCARIPDPELVRACRHTSWLIASLVALERASELIFGASALVFVGWVQLFSAILSIALFIFFLRAISLHVKIARRFRQQARLAEANWAEHAPPSAPGPHSTNVR